MSSENKEKIKDKSPERLLGTFAGIPDNSKIKVSAFPVLSLLIEIPPYTDGSEKVTVVVSRFEMSAFPFVLFSPSEMIKSAFVL